MPSAVAMVIYLCTLISFVIPLNIFVSLHLYKDITLSLQNNTIGHVMNIIVNTIWLSKYINPHS